MLRVIYLVGGFDSRLSLFVEGVVEHVVVQVSGLGLTFIEPIQRIVLLSFRFDVIHLRFYSCRVRHI